MKHHNLKMWWRIERIYESYNSVLRRCNECLNKVIEILDGRRPQPLKQSEVLSHNRHLNKRRLKTFASNTACGNVI